MKNSELAFKSASALAELVAEKQVSAVELTRYFIERIERTHKSLNAVVVQDFERALAAAEVRDRELHKSAQAGPLQGVPMTVKESFNVAGLKTTWGMPMWKDMVAQSDAEVVARLKGAGAIVLGKTNVPLLLGDYQSYNAIYGQTNNPWDVSRGPGGSSGGSAAALAAGLVGLEAGSDIGGSLRNPAHYCGVYSHKPTWGVVPSAGHQPPVVEVSNGADLAVVGPMARSAADLRLAMELLPGPMPLQSRGWQVNLPPARMQSLKGLRVAFWHTDEQAPVSAEILARSQQLAARLRERGAIVDEEARPDIDMAAGMLSYIYLMQAVNTSGVPDSVYEANRAAAAAFDADDFSIPALFAKASVQSHNEWVRHDGLRHRTRMGWNTFFENVDVLIAPIGTTTAFPHDHSEPPGARMLEVDGNPQPMFASSFWAGMVSFAGLPSTVFPTRLSASGLPIGLQAISREYDDQTCLQFAELMEQELGGFVPPPDFV